MSSKQSIGSIYQLEKDKPRGRCRKWKLIVPLGRDAATGKHRQKNRNFTGSYTQAQKALVIFAEEVTTGQVVAKSNYTLNAYIDHFIAAREMSGEVAPGTIRREKEKLRSLAFLIGEMKLQEITPDVLEKAYLDLRAGNSRSGKRLSGTYLNDINKKMSLLMDHAKKNGIVAENPCSKADKPKPDTPEKRALLAEDIRALLAALNPTEHMQCAVILCTTLGLRRGEAVGLSWEDVDFENRTIHVRHSYDDAGRMNTPKTKAGNRFLPISDTVYDALQKRLAVQTAYFTNYAPELTETDDEGNVVGVVGEAAVISDPLGKRIHPAGLGHWWYNHRKDYGLEGWTLHQLRHSFLTLAAQQGVHPSVMQKLAGHSTSRITMEVYTHANMDAQRAAMNSLEEVFS